MDTTKTLLTSVRHFFSGTILSRMTGVARDMTMAYAFGAHSSIAAFFVAYRLAHLLRRVLGEGAMQSAFIPKFEEFKKENPFRACRFFADLYGTVIIALIAIILLGSVSIGWTLFYGNLSPGNQEIFSLILIMFPSLFFICLFGLNSAILQCEKNYFIPSSAPVFFNLTWILGTLLILYANPESPMLWLSGVIIVACLAQWAITLPKTLHILRQHGIRVPWKNFSLFSQDLRVIGKPLFLGVLGIAAAQINNALDGIFARIASSDGPAFLWYAIRVQQLPLGLFAIAFAGALLPPLTRSIKDNDKNKFRYFLNYSLRKCVWVMVPFSLILILLGKWGIQLVYGHGQFDQHAIDQTSLCLYAYTFGLIPMALVLVAAPAFYAQNQYSIPTKASIFAMGLNMLLNAIFIMGFGLGAVAVALATSISAWVNFFILFAKLKPYVGKTLTTELTT